MSEEDPHRGIDRSPVGGSGTPRDADPPQPPLRVTVYHGDLGSVGLPVIVGSNDGTPIRGAERTVDEFLDGAVSRRAALRRLHGAAGTCELFTARGTTVPAALVIGLGNPGDLTPGGLADLITQAVLRFAAERLDQLPVRGTAGGGPHETKLAAVLVGTTGQAPLTVAASLAALVTGTRRANRLLADRARQVLTDPEPQLTIDELRIVELYEERAIEAQHAAARLSDELGGDGAGLTVEPRVLDGCEGRAGLPPPSYEDNAWRTVRIVGLRPPARARADALVELSFTSVGRSARAEQQVTSAQRTLVEQLVAEAISSPLLDEQLCNTLYELLVPNAMKGQGRASENLMCVVDEYAAVLPLEMLAFRAFGNKIVPLVVEGGVVRRLETRTYRPRVRASTGTRALVIADPPGTGLPQLDGARAEATLVADVLESKGYQVTRRITTGRSDGPPDISGILNALFAQEYRIVHVAGHGVYDGRSPAGTGVLIGSGRVLSALEVEKMSAVPDLVFLNCCHLGKMGASVSTSPAPLRADRLAATISRQLVDNGVRAIVAAGWAVNDTAAAEFAQRFYTELLDGGDLGSATTEARKYVWKKFDTYNTFGAYQVYGPPSFRLDIDRRRGRDDEKPVAPREFRDALDRIGRWADNLHRGFGTDLPERLSTLLAAAPQAWQDDELERIGKIWTALGDYDAALKVFERARTAWSGQASLRSLEQLVNVKAKYACQLLAADPADAQAQHLLEEAGTSIGGLLKVSATPERLSILGSLERRRAQFPTLGSAREALERSLAAYREAEALHVEGVGDVPGAGVDHYSGLNRVVVGWLLSLHGAPVPDVEEAVATITRCADAVAARPCPDFWCRVTPADCAFTRALVEGELTDPRARDGVAYEYEAVFAARSTRRERLTVVEHLGVLERCLPADGADARVAETRKALADLRERLKERV